MSTTTFTKSNQLLLLLLSGLDLDCYLVLKPQCTKCCQVSDFSPNKMSRILRFSKISLVKRMAKNNYIQCSFVLPSPPAATSGKKIDTF